MNLLLAFPTYLQNTGKLQHASNTAAMDWFVIATLCCFFFLLGCFAAVAWQIWRRTTRPEPHVQLLMELAESDEEKVIQNADETAQDDNETRLPWEKPQDWWKA